MTDYVAVASAVRDTLLADAWLGNAANVKIIESYPRGFSLQDGKGEMYFPNRDQPAIAVVPNAQPKKSEQISATEIATVVRVEANTVSFDRDAQAGMANHHAIVENVEHVLQKQATEANDLGIGARVSGVSTRDRRFKKGEVYVFVSATEFDVEIVAAFG